MQPANVLDASCYLLAISMLVLQFPNFDSRKQSGDKLYDYLISKSFSYAVEIKNF